MSASAQSIVPYRWSNMPWVSGSNLPVASAYYNTNTASWNSKSFQVQAYGPTSPNSQSYAFFPVAQESINSTDTLTGLSFYPVTVPFNTKLIYALNSGSLYTFDYRNFSQTKLPITLPAGHGARLLKTFSDASGHKLAFVTTDPATSKDEICVYSLDSNTFLAKFDSQNGTTASVDFLYDTTIVASGPTLYNYSGKMLHMVPNGANPQPVLIAPGATYAESRLYSVSSGTTKTISAYDTYLTQLWSEPIPANTSGNYVQLGSTGLAFPGLVTNSDPTKDQWIITDISTVDGSFISTTPFHAMADVQPMLFRNTFGTGEGALWETDDWMNNPLTEIATPATSGLPGRDAFSLFGLGTIKYWVEDTINGHTYYNPQGYPSIVTDEVTFDSSGKPNGSQFVARDFDTGLLTNVTIEPVETANSIANPTGDFVAVADGSLKVFSEQYQTLLASYAGVKGPFAWGGSNIIANYNGASVFTFNGTSLKLAHTFPILNTARATYEMSPDGKRVAMFNAAGGVVVFNSTTGALIGTVPGDQYAKVTAFYMANGYIGIQIVRGKSAGDSINFNSFYIFADSGGALAPTVSVGYALPSDLRTSGHYGGALSQDGKYFMLASQAADPAFPTFAGSSIRVYRSSDGVLLDRWDNQLLPNFENGNQIFTFSPDDLNLIWMTGGGYYAAPIGAQLITAGINYAFTTPALAIQTLAPTPSGGEVFKISTTGPSLVKLPSTITVPAGITQYSLPVQIVYSNTLVQNTITVTDSFGNKITQDVTLDAPYLVSAVPSATSIVGGQSLSFTVSLSHPCAPTGLTVNLFSDNTAAPVPSTLVIPGGLASKTISFSTKAVTSATTVTYDFNYNGNDIYVPVTLEPK